MNSLWLISAAALGFLIWYFLKVLDDPFKGFLIMLPFMIVTRSVELPVLGERLIFFDILLVVWWLGIFIRAGQGYRDLRLPRSLFWLAFIYYLALVAAFASLLNGQFILRGMNELLIYLFLGLFGLATIAITHSKERLVAVAKWSVGALTLATVYAIWEVASLRFDLPVLFDIESTRRLSGSFRQTNQLAGFLRTLLPLAWAMLFMAEETWRTRVMLSLVVVGSIYALLLTSSRSNLLAAMIEVVLLSVAVIWFILSKRGASPVVPLILSILLLAGAFVIVPQVAGSFWRTFLLRTLPFYQNVVQVASPSDLGQFLMARGSFLEGNWGTAWQAFRDHPFLGIGIGNFGSTYQSFNGEHYEVHSGFLNLLTERGILGTIPMFIFLAMSLWYAIAGLLSKNTIYWLAIALLISYLGSGFAGVYVVFLRRREFWLVLGLIVTSWYIYEQSREEVFEVEAKGAIANEHA